MFDNKGSQLRYRHPLPFEEDNYEITQANLHDYLNMCRPKRSKKYQHSGGVLPNEQKLDHKSFKHVRKFQPTNYNSSNLHNSALDHQDQAHYQSNKKDRGLEQLQRQKRNLFPEAIERIKPSSTTHSKRVGICSLSKQGAHKEHLRQTSHPFQLSIPQKNGSVLKVGHNNNNSTELEGRTYFKPRNQKKLDNVGEKDRTPSRNDSQSSFLEFQMVADDIMVRTDSQGRDLALGKKIEKNSGTAPVPESTPDYSTNLNRDKMNKNFLGLTKNSPLLKNIFKNQPIHQETHKQISNVHTKICAAECFKGRRPYNEDRYICLINCGSIRDKMKQALFSNASSGKKFLSSKNQPITGHLINQHLLSNHVRIRNVPSALSHQNTIEQNCEKNSQKMKYDLFAVFDGHGGSKCSEFLKQNLYQILSMNKNLFIDPCLALKECVHKMEQKFIGMIEKQGNVDLSGSCAVISIVKGTQIFIANVGDSRALLLSRETVKQVTKDHKPDDPEEKMRIIKHGGKLYKDGASMKFGEQGCLKVFSQTRVMPGSLNVSRTIGDIESKMKKYGGSPGIISFEPQIFQQKSDGYECLLLASDGLFEGLTNQQIHKIYQNWSKTGQKDKEKDKGFPNQQQANSLVKQLISQSGIKSTDNITVICAFMSE